MTEYVEVEVKITKGIGEYRHSVCFKNKLKV